ncbi:MAG: LysR family transcriptional regulator [Burkholderiales bacterium]|nr:LysR family transcriptional regulator [Betaproteobacteria bacterium]MDE2398483.1 LysR family transcriptional regulator [Burkholderiales bacterium]
MGQQTLPSASVRLRLSLRQLEVFVATARAGTTRGAADQVARSQSAASAALADLETAVGVLLFDRVGRRLLLNENGRALLPKAAALLDRAAEAQTLFSGEHDAPLRVAASLSIGEYMLPELIARWKGDHPASPVHLMIGNTREVIAAVAAFDVDIGFIEGPQTHPQLIVHPWLSDELVIVAAPDHALAHQTAGLRQLRESPWALREQGSGTREAVDRWLLERLGSMRVEFELGSTEAIKRLVAAGVALGCLAREVVARELEQGLLVEVSTRLPRATRRLAMVVHRDKHLGQGAEAFVRHCAAALEPEK